MGIKSVISRAPTRIDLAGGTLDIWPLFLFLKDPLTINLATSLCAEAKLDFESKADHEVILESIDQEARVQFAWADIESSLKVPPGLELHLRLLRHFARELKQTRRDLPSLHLSTRAESPAGAGLGGSSTLAIAIIGAIGTWARSLQGLPPIDPHTEGERYIETVRDVETTVIRVPAGMQDYYGAMFGGLQSLRWGAGAHLRNPLPSYLLGDLENRILLFYSGQSRNSGINNWVLFKDFIDNQGDTQSRFQNLATITGNLERALFSRNWTDVGRAIDEEWQVRKTLAPGITTPEMDQAFEVCRKFGPITGKVCGAGGGGCFFVFLPFESQAELAKKKEEITRAVQGLGPKHLPFTSSSEGLQIRVERA